MRRVHRIRRTTWFRNVGGALLAAVACAAPASEARPQLAELSLEQLRDVVVSTVSRFEERLHTAAASVYVISGDDIRRSGATTLPEALRLAPTLDVARADANQYAISARGFNNVLANKMLVLIDGRTVYTPLFSGVFWEAQDVLLEDVERIEVVTGPSTALWGSNAVNGLIHVITRDAAGTQGTLASAHAGRGGRGAALRHGLRLGDDGFLRAYAKAYRRDETHRLDGASVHDQAEGAQVGFRADWSRPMERLAVQGDASEGSIGPPPLGRRFSGINLLARWERSLADGANLTVQGYLERTRREHPLTFRERLDTADLVVEYGFRPWADHRVLVGAGHRRSIDRVPAFEAVAFLPEKRRLTWSRLYAQDQVSLPAGVTATAAVSLEHNPYTGSEVLPSLRLAWQADPRSLVWTSFSRAVRAPSRVDREFFQPARPPHLVAGGPGFTSEVADVLELGFRSQPSASWSYALTLFRHAHDRLRSLAPSAAGLQFRNGIEGTTHGLEAWTRWQPTERWRLDAGGVLLRQKLILRAGEADLGGLAALGNDPRHWWSLRSALEVAPGVSWDVSVRRIGRRPLPLVPAYTAFDTRLAWAFSAGGELALVLQNVGDPGHAEWGGAANRVELERSASIQLRWQH